jgi:hypothetical protein
MGFSVDTAESCHLPESELAFNTGVRNVRKGSQYGLTWDMVNWKGRMLNILRTKNEEPVHVPLIDCCFGRPQGCARAGATEEGVCFGRPIQENGLKMVDIGLMTYFLKPELRTFGGTICGQYLCEQVAHEGRGTGRYSGSSGAREFDDDEAVRASGAEQVAHGRVFAETK